jgi:hypothetical protein
MKFWPIIFAEGLVASRLLRLRLILLGVLVLGLEVALVGGDVFLLLFGGDTFLLFLDFVVAGGELFLEVLLVFSAVALLEDVLEAVLLLAFVEGFASGLFLELFLEAALLGGDSISDRFRFFVEDGGDNILMGD